MNLVLFTVDLCPEDKKPYIPTLWTARLSAPARVDIFLDYYRRIQIDFGISNSILKKGDYKTKSLEHDYVCVS